MPIIPFEFVLTLTDDALKVTVSPIRLKHPIAEIYHDNYYNITKQRLMSLKPSHLVIS